MSRPKDPPGVGFVLSINKRSPWTSHDAVARVRRILGIRKVGHTGTLDPFATGVLLCCVGRATKLSNALMELRKEYEGWMRFGVKTTTGDSSGEMLQEWSAPLPAGEQLHATARRFEGKIMQVPPMVSALKHQGRRLYQLARKGITVEREARPVVVDAFEILEVAEPRVRFRVRCARGTYVRTLVEDFGEALGAGACVDELCRTRVGGFAVEEAVDLEAVEGAEELAARAIPMAEAVGHLPAWTVPSFWATKLRRGQAPPWVVLDVEEPPREGQTGRLLGAEGDLLALGRAALSPGPADRPWQDALRLELLRVI